MTEETKETKLSIDVVQFTLTPDGTFRAKSNADAEGGLYVPLRSIVRLIGEITQQQSDAFKLLTCAIRDINIEATNLMKKDL